MAGIGFELRKILRQQTLFGVARAYAYAGLISSGPLILSIFGILIIGVMSVAFAIPKYAIVQFQVSVTYLIACSLILTGPLQLSFTRFISDRLFEKRDDLVLSNYNGVATIATAASGCVGLIAAVSGFRGEPLLYRLLMVAGFVIVSNIWIAVIFLSSVKQYPQILAVFLVGYGCTVAFALMLNRHGICGLLGGFVAGHLVLFAGLSGLIYRNYRSDRFVSFEMLDRRFAYPTLALVGLLFNLGVWLDKFIFWYAPGTGAQVIGPLHASVIYDIPVFIAYVCVMPGMATFLVRIEADFVEYYDAFYEAVRSGATLRHINDMRDMMVGSVRAGLYEIIKVQAVVLVLIVAFGHWLLAALHISTLYLPLLLVDVIAASLQVLLLGLLNVFFYLDARRLVVALSAAFVALNGVLTGITLWMTPDAYGYGFALALLILDVAAVLLLDRKFGNLEYETYMLRH
ncbi:histidine kinase [Burkholderia contaminans FFH2055]|uniref:exopolysaccharide Pel transporter PelG n=1 Tax=Burkholderia contaminans TaxID=488447 RepID=UPI0006255AF5|nr:exopolysaccharide Pel transporter PelG [Burkholderia contaminans]KKL35691.1 histidine kinase [Burkholderia contaminans FFH2055]MEB4636782.1 exopolysaccharide Pel transporter PelG [Burkholderia contaminans]MEB4651675.1 exopolysaccharide Pel transporter PelG [Burkholderia contaminans]MEB4661246.1 exopolysaccharide Pel transporter PelG [Burkholderia contaminans]MEB4667144.1 exopolysaccharide Pel transporter PelG [Burkholderia contaminans]